MPIDEQKKLLKGTDNKKMYYSHKRVNLNLNKDDKKTIEPIIKQLQKSVTAHGKQAKQLKKDIADEKDLEEADLSKSQVTKVHKQADDLPKKDFMKRYGKDGDAVRYATATNMVKKKLGIGEDNKLIKKGELKMNESYKLKLNSAMEHYKITSLAELKDEDQKAFFSYVDGLDEGLSAGQKKLPPALQKAILAKQGKKEVKEEDAYDKDDEKPAPKPKPKKEELSAAQKKLPAGLQKAIKDKETKSESLINTYESLIKTWEAASHKMPDGTMMKGAKHKDETKDEANDVDNGDEKKPVATKDVKKLADSGSKLTKVETEPEADFKN